MRVGQTSLLYLLFLGTLCSVITQDTSSEETNIEPDARSYLGHLYHKFEGSWHSTSYAQIVTI